MSKKYIGLKEDQVDKYILTRPTRISDLTFEDLYEDDRSGWYSKARKLQARSWRKIRHQLV